ncbi:MAG: DMT family transporter [Candidatus Roizmanbacteria bacterium]|nr:DMT family transporter [Candidatus Roizmanbacteria bacterium]
MNWFILALLAGTASNFFNIFNRSSLKEKGDSTVYAWWFEVIRFIVFLIIFLPQQVFPQHVGDYFWLLLLGLNEAVSVYFFMRSHQLTDLSLSTFIVKLQLIWTPLLAFFFIGEHLSLLDYGAIGIILVGIFIAIYSKKMKNDKGVIITFISSLFIAFNAVFTKKVTGISSTPFIIMSMSLPSIIIFPLLMKSSYKRIVTISKKTFLQCLSGSISNIIAMFLAINAIRLGSTSKVSAVYQGMMIISLLYSIVILKERKQLWQKIVGAGVILLGLYILSR